MQVSWIDPDEIALLAQQLRPRPPAPPPKEDPLGLELIMQSELMAAEGLSDDFGGAFGAIDAPAGPEAAEPAPPVVDLHTVADRPATGAALADPSIEEDKHTPAPEVFVSIREFDVPEANVHVSITEIDDPTVEGDVTVLEFDTPSVEIPEPAHALQVVEVHFPAVPPQEPDVETESPAPMDEISRSPELNAIRNQLQAIRERAIGAGLLTPQSRPPSASPPKERLGAAFDGQGLPADQRNAHDPGSLAAAPNCEEPESSTSDISFEVPLGTIMQRLDAFAGWALRRLGGGDVLIVDQHGDLLWGPQAKAGLILSTMMACSAAMHASAMAACAVPPSIQQPLASGNLLTIIPCRTRLGMLQVAIARPDVVPADEAELLRQALTVAIDTEGV